MRPAGPAFRAIALIVTAALALTSLPARAQTGSTAGIPMIRDAEIEQLLREYSQPILRAAGLGQQNVQIVIINDKTFNAFVMDAHRIFVNSGALMQATTPNELIGVFAHETGHIVGGHLSKMRQELANATTAAIVAMLLGAGAMVAGGEIEQLRQQPRHGQCRRRDLQRAAVLPRAYAARLSARPRRSGRPLRASVF